MVNDQNQPSWDNFPSQKPQQRPEEQIPAMKQPQRQEEQKSTSWGQFQSPSTYQGKPDPTAEESTLGWLARNVVSNSFRIDEQVAGRYGTIKKGLTDVVKKLPQTTGLLGTALHKWVGQDVWNKLIEGQKNPEIQGFNIPGPQDIRKITEAVTGDYTKPKTPNEKKVQNVSEDIGATLAFGRPRHTRDFLVNNLGIPAAANVVKEAVEAMGFKEDKSTYAKLGAWTVFSLLSNVNGPAFASALTNLGRNGIPQNLSANIQRYGQSLNRLNFLSNDPRSALARQQLQGIRDDIANGQTSVRDLMNRYDAINAAKRDKGLFDLNPGDRASAIRHINQVRDAVREEITIAARNHPQALQNWNDGIHAWRTIHESRRMTNWIESALKGPYGKAIATTVLPLFTGGTTWGLSKLPAAIATPAVAAAPALYKAGQIAYRVFNDPQLSRYYWGAVSGAARENSAAFINNFEKLNRYYEKRYGNSSIEGKNKKQK